MPRVPNPLAAGSDLGQRLIAHWLVVDKSQRIDQPNGLSCGKLCFEPFSQLHLPGNPAQISLPGAGQ